MRPLSRLVLLAAPMLALGVLGVVALTWPATPAISAEPRVPAACQENLAAAAAGMQSTQARLRSLAETRGPELCSATRQYFLELVKARAVTALCKSGSERSSEMSRLNNVVENVNDQIAVRCTTKVEPPVRRITKFAQVDLPRSSAPSL